MGRLGAKSTQPHIQLQLIGDVNALMLYWSTDGERYQFLRMMSHQEQVKGCKVSVNSRAPFQVSN
jgi:hypothetical protein